MLINDGGDYHAGLPNGTRRRPTLAGVSKVLLAGCTELPRGDGDEDGLIEALATHDIDADWMAWDDPAEVAAADLVVLRATWNYAERREQFLRWCASVPRLRNGVDVVRWNTDKTYLTDLADAGLSIVPTEVVPPGQAPQWPDAEVVVKPTVGAGSRRAGRFAAHERPAAEAHLRQLHADEYTALVQPYQPTVDERGETAVVFLAGLYSHAFTKGPMLGGNQLDASGLFIAENVFGTTPDADELSFADAAIDTACGVLGVARGELLYARVDVVRGRDDKPALLELELAEPSLGLSLVPAAATERFAAAIADVVSSSR